MYERIIKNMKQKNNNKDLLIYFFEKNLLAINSGVKIKKKEILILIKTKDKLFSKPMRDMYIITPATKESTIPNISGIKF